MTHREKIIVGLAVLSLGYGAIEFMLPRTKPAPPLQAQSAEGLTAFISKIAEATRSLGAEASSAVIQKAEAAWNQNPFMDIPKAKAPEVRTEVAKTADRPLPNLVYSGFLEVGSKRLAIINGQEYEAGDKLDPGGFTLKSILPTRVMITSAQWGSTPIVLPLQESE
ncbi:MAG: general secretion pathway protein GspB [Desulfobacterales bacterium]|jgi:hypothetical protein|nr:general secretion pathway protein GspB [Desulfobacterales bacterium]